MKNEFTSAANAPAGTYKARREVRRAMRKPEKDVADFSRAIEIGESLLADGAPQDKRDLINSYMSRKNYFFGVKNFWGATGDHMREESLRNDDVPAQNSFLEFRERVSDSIFGRRDWVYLSEEEKRQIRLGDAASISESPADLSAFEVRRHRLSFFEDATLLEIYGIGRRAGEGPFWFLERGGRIDLVNGSTYFMDDDYKTLVETRESVLDYIRYYFFFVHGKNGPCFILDDVDHPVLDRSRLDEFQIAVLEEKVFPPTHHYDFAYDVCLVYGDALLRTTFIFDFVIEYTGETVLAEGLPVHRLKPDYRIISRDHDVYR